MTFLVELVETDPFTACRGKHPDRHGNQAKGKVAFPDSRSHLNDSFGKQPRDCHMNL